MRSFTIFGRSAEQLVKSQRIRACIFSLGCVYRSVCDMICARVRSGNANDTRDVCVCVHELGTPLVICLHVSNWKMLPIIGCPFFGVVSGAVLTVNRRVRNGASQSANILITCSPKRSGNRYAAHFSEASGHHCCTVRGTAALQCGRNEIFAESINRFWMKI